MNQSSKLILNGILEISELNRKLEISQAKKLIWVMGDWKADNTFQYKCTHTQTHTPYAFANDGSKLIKIGMKP